MQDRPTRDELLAAVERFLAEEVVERIDAGRRFHARVAANVIGIVRREIAHAPEQTTREWRSLAVLLGHGDERPGRAACPESPTELNEAIRSGTEELCARIQRGDADAPPFREAVLGHVRATVRDKLDVSNPKWIRPR
jgi:hypothetical protein